MWTVLIRIQITAHMKSQKSGTTDKERRRIKMTRFYLGDTENEQNLIAVTFTIHV